jgi:hypothetical protein
MADARSREDWQNRPNPGGYMEIGRLEAVGSEAMSAHVYAIRRRTR